MMTLPRAVMDDLLALYLAGDAAPVTRQMVEDYAHEHSDYAAVLRSAANLKLPGPPTGPRADLELAALKKTREFVRLRSIFLGSGIFFTLTPFMFRFGHGGFEWLIIGYANNGVAWAAASLAAASWVSYWLMNREVRKAGL